MNGKGKQQNDTDFQSSQSPGIKTSLVPASLRQFIQIQSEIEAKEKEEKKIRDSMDLTKEKNNIVSTSAKRAMGKETTNGVDYKKIAYQKKKNNSKKGNKFSNEMNDDKDKDNDNDDDDSVRSFCSEDFELPELEMDDGRELQRLLVAEKRKQQRLKEEEERKSHYLTGGSMSLESQSQIAARGSAGGGGNAAVFLSPLRAAPLPVVPLPLSLATLDSFSHSATLLRLEPNDVGAGSTQMLNRVLTIPTLDKKAYTNVRSNKVYKNKALLKKMETELEIATIHKYVGKQMHYPYMRKNLDSLSYNSEDYDRDHGAAAGEAEAEAEVSTLDHPLLGSLEEKLEDLRQEETEQWCLKRGRPAACKYINKDKRVLRRWFNELDYDHSGEVNVAELQDPLLSSGIFKTKEQVKRVLSNVDKNHTMGIDFEEFLIALHGNKLADVKKLQRLQDMNSNVHGFEMTTLISHERRKKLMHSIMTQSEKRLNQFDSIFEKAGNSRFARRDRDKAFMELDTMEEKHNKAKKLHEQYINALHGVLVENRELQEAQDHHDRREERRKKREDEIQLMERRGDMTSAEALAAFDLEDEEQDLLRASSPTSRRGNSPQRISTAASVSSSASSSSSRGGASTEEQTAAARMISMTSGHAIVSRAKIYAAVGPKNSKLRVNASNRDVNSNRNIDSRSSGFTQTSSRSRERR